MLREKQGKKEISDLQRGPMESSRNRGKERGATELRKREGVRKFHPSKNSRGGENARATVPNKRENSSGPLEPIRSYLKKGGFPGSTIERIRIRSRTYPLRNENYNKWVSA